LVPLLVVGALVLITLMAGVATVVMLVVMRQQRVAQPAPIADTPPVPAPPPADTLPTEPVVAPSREPEAPAPAVRREPLRRASPEEPSRRATGERARTAREPEPMPTPTAAPVQPLRAGGKIPPPTKIRDVRPVYPDIAQRARVQGVVILEATIDPTGKIADLRVLRSIPLLDQAALDAVRQWEYEPTHLNGIAVPVIMTVTVNFKLQ
jgi:protein TonB